MYGKFKTYKEIPYTNRAIRKNYTDTADTGEDNLCSIKLYRHGNRELYIGYCLHQRFYGSDRAYGSYYVGEKII